MSKDTSLEIEKNILVALRLTLNLPSDLSLRFFIIIL